jgi:hypothetical protein
LGLGVIFQLELKDRSYVLRGKDVAEVQRWIQCLTLIRDEAKANSIPEEPEDGRSPIHVPRPESSSNLIKSNLEVSGSGMEKKTSGSCCVIH